MLRPCLLLGLASLLGACGSAAPGPSAEGEAPAPREESAAPREVAPAPEQSEPVASAPAPFEPPGPCVEVPERSWILEVTGREAHPPPGREQPTTLRQGYSTHHGVDLDGDGTPDALVPSLADGVCPHEIEWEAYVMRGDCGHLVGRVEGLLREVGPVPTGGLAELRVGSRWSDLTDPARPPGPRNVATLHETVTRWRWDPVAGTYEATGTERRDGICHHCPVFLRCRVVAGP
ncbi:MAG TPA: hypothetical protein RMH85_27670 [Polyangiaceae bacterium LLY-WYZ-15_(1-7)]|nr:hypothetical protein [Myxococcales bacterium]MAT28932.1 hypothetical protein [Sandaracinus sp.]HJL00937.1 hypothetical protein [Polyangiaceae bacterium LLY-WYZ-15_(1-7)]MBJ73062.1 hypothetical protein [Sandaracinus sp.]HJL12289.1 hypothetical protein [Polyangiaceae bacterium LLY-WYZ-15_(1-7)]